MISRRVRAILRTTLSTCVPWTILGALVGAVVQLQHAAVAAFAFGRPVPGGVITAFAIAGAFVGLINGLSFSLLLLATERGKSVEQLIGWRFAAWGAIATAAPLGLLFQSGAIAGAGGALGAAAAFAGLWGARRVREDRALGATPSLPPR